METRRRHGDCDIDRYVNDCTWPRYALAPLPGCVRVSSDWFRRWRCAYRRLMAVNPPGWRNLPALR
jgi:hypothetical protein